MGWSVGYDSKWQRDIGYGVPSICDYPTCTKKIDRGLSYVCNNNEPYGGDDGCGLYFCPEHLTIECTHEGMIAKPDTKQWIKHKLKDDSWQEWRNENPEKVLKMIDDLTRLK